MKKFLLLSSFIFLVQASHLSMSFAHELLPENVIQLLQENPNLTVEELDAIMQDQDAPVETSKTISTSTQKKADTILGVKDPNASTGMVIIEFIKLGIQHILEGLDHILFVLALLLVFNNCWSILKLVTSFTIAHSITLVLAGSGFFTLSSRIVEPLIALSIAYVAIFTVFFQKSELIKTERRKLLGVFFFGLFHGLGFAGLLSDFAIPSNHFLTSLLSFNIGVEIGQVIILGLTIPYILLFRNRSWYPTFIKVFSIVIAQLGMVWFFERSFDLTILGL